MKSFKEFNESGQFTYTFPTSKQANDFARAISPPTTNAVGGVHNNGRGKKVTVTILDKKQNMDDIYDIAIEHGLL